MIENNVFIHRKSVTKYIFNVVLRELHVNKQNTEQEECICIFLSDESLIMLLLKEFFMNYISSYRAKDVRLTYYRSLSSNKCFFWHNSWNQFQLV